MTLPKATSFRPGPLAAAIEKKLTKTGETLSEYIRRLIAEDLGKPSPQMQCGNPSGFAEINKRRKNTKTRKAKR
jgi:hypothetical protein